LHVNQVQLIYLATLPKPTFSATEESLEVQLFSEDEIPWDNLAFYTISNALRFYFKDRKAGQFLTREIVLSNKEQALNPPFKVIT
ncbi:MAG: hypothetical protein ACPGPF_09140, partial [Pontibacterium sp.]